MTYKKYLFILMFLLPMVSQAALSNRAIFQIDGEATAGNLNAGYFNPDNANMAADGTVDANTGNTASPVFSSASYNFTAGDIYDWLYIKSNTGGDTYQNCWYQITNVSANKATLGATAGDGNCRLERLYATTTANGISTAATPTGITWSMDYSFSTTAPKSWVSGGSSFTNDLTCTNATPSVCTSASYNFDEADIGNGLHVTAGTNLIAAATSRWAEIVSVSGGAATLDKNITSGAGNLSGGTAYLGGAMSLNSTLDDDLFEQGLPGMQFYIKYNSSNISLGETVNISANGGATNPIDLIWYYTKRGDITSSYSENRTLINTGGNSWTIASNWFLYNCNITGTGSTVLINGGSNKIFNCKVVNTSTTADRNSVQSGANNFYYNLESISYRGRAFTHGNGGHFGIYGCYLHDSKTGIQFGATNNMVTVISNCLIADNTNYAIYNPNNNTLNAFIMNSTLYGAENNIGIGIDNGSGVSNFHFTNNIFYGLSTAASSTNIFASTTASNGSIISRNNNYYNNTLNYFNLSTSTRDTFLNPTFTNVAQITGTGATSATNVVTMPGADLSNVVDNQDFFTLISGTGTGLTANTKYLITAHDDSADTVTVSSNITSSGNGSNIVWHITTGHNFAIGTNLKAGAEPNIFPGGLTTGYKDVGGVQRQETGTAASSIPSWAY